MIYNSCDLWSVRVLKSRRVPSPSFTHAPTTDKEKLDVDALDDFIQNLLMCLLCTINLKPLGVSRQSVASAALLLPGEVMSCFVNWRDGDACILMADFGCSCILTNAKEIIAGCFAVKLGRATDTSLSRTPTGIYSNHFIPGLICCNHDTHVITVLSCVCVFFFFPLMHENARSRDLCYFI